MRVYRFGFSIAWSLLCGLLVVASWINFDGWSDFAIMMISTTLSFSFIGIAIEEVIRYIREGNYYEKK